MKKAFWGVLLVSGSLGVSTAAAHEVRWSEPSHAEDNWSPVGDDATLPPGVPGESFGTASEGNVMALEEALADNGYDPGPIDGMIDSDTRAAIREVQEDHDLAVTGSIDRETEQQLGMSRGESFDRARSSS